MGALPPARRATEDITLRNGIHIPKNAQVFNCFTAIHMDERNFDDPTTFKPERFFENGKFVKNEKVVLFGLGKRRCPGEILARAEYFLILTTLIQTFQMKATGPIDFTTVPGLGFTTQPYEVTFIQRNWFARS